MEKGKIEDGGYGAAPPPPYSSTVQPPYSSSTVQPPYSNTTVQPPQAPAYNVDPPYNTVHIPPGTGYAPQGSYTTQQYTTTVSPVVQVIQFSNLRSRSTRMVCPHCRADVNTRISYRSGRFTHVAALVLCLLFCCICAVVPYCVDACQDVEHFCPNCQQFIGVYRR